MSRDTKLGVLCAGGAFLFWGLTPVFWKLIQEIPALEILAHRVVWGVAFLALWMSVRGRWPELGEVLRRPRTSLVLLASTGFIAVNWGLFIWAVNSGRVLSTSLGYFINPLVSVLLGLVVLGERLNRRQWIAVALAGLAVAILTLEAGRLPWVSLALAFSFGFYGLLRKVVAADAVVGATFETGTLSFVALSFLALRESSGLATFGHQGLSTDLLLVLSGAVTVVPLVLFTLGVRRIALSTAGILQYIAPTCTFLLAVFLYREPFSAVHGFSFGLIWCALALYSFDLRQRYRAQLLAPLPAAQR